MRAVIISIALLIVVVTGTLVNLVFVNSRIDEMKCLAESICDDKKLRSENITELYELWERSYDLLSFSTSLREIDRATENLLTLQAACESDNEWAIKQSCVLFCNALDDIARYEKFSLGSIL